MRAPPAACGTPPVVPRAGSERAGPGSGGVDPWRGARGAWHQIGRPELEVRSAAVQRGVNELVTAIDEALAGLVNTALAARIVRIDEGHFARLDRHQHRAGVAVPAGRPAGRDHDLLRHEVDR